MPFLIGLALIILGSFGILMPLITRFTLKAKASPPVIPEELSAIEEPVSRIFVASAPALAQLGFACAGYLRIDGYVGSLRSYVSLWVNRSCGDTASVIAVPTTARLVMVSGFDTRFSDGSEVATNNNTSAGILARVPDRHLISLPNFNDLARLYSVHRERVAHWTPPGATPVLPESGQEIETFQSECDESLRLQMQAGRWYLNEKSNVYRPTLVGAFLMTWGLLWPISSFRKWLRRRRVVRELRAIGIAVP